MSYLSWGNVKNKPKSEASPWCPFNFQAWSPWHHAGLTLRALSLSWNIRARAVFIDPQHAGYSGELLLVRFWPAQASSPLIYYVTRPWKHWKMKWQRLTYHKSPLLMWKNKCRSQTWHLWSGPFNTGFCPCACVQNLLTTLCSVNDNWVLKMLNYLPTQSFTE